MAVRILVVDDDRALAETLVQGLSGQGRIATACTRADEALALIAATAPDVVVTDLRMPGVDGLELCQRIGRADRDVPVIVMTAFGDYEAAVLAMRAGAYDFLAKPVKLDVLELAVGRAIERRYLRREVKRLTEARDLSLRPVDLVGASPAMERVYTLLGRVADASTSVLVTGESGTGKELVARALHRSSPRARGPFVAINCAAMPEALLESELFGHAKGAFTDGRTAKAGLFLEASGGTLFLDEIGEMPMSLQPKLLRVLQERTLRPVGGRKEIPFDVRIVAATNRDLHTAVEEGRFREDLFFRLDVIEIALPPLRERGTDVVLLVEHFLTSSELARKKGVLGCSAPATKLLLEYDWPGNVRELANVLERAVALGEHDSITVEDLPEKLTRPRRSPRVPLPLDPGELVTLDEMEQRYVQYVLDASGGSRSLAAKTLGLDRTTLWRRLERARPKSGS